MAQLLLISEKTLKGKDNRKIGDIVGIFPDNHVFSEHEKDIFDIVKYDDSKMDIKTNEQGNVEVHTLCLKDNKYFLDDLKENGIMKEVWLDGSDYKEIKIEPRFKKRFENNEIKDNYSYYNENKETTILISESVLDGR